MSIATIATFLWQIDGPDARLTKFRKPWKQEISGAASHTRSGINFASQIKTHSKTSQICRERESRIALADFVAKRPGKSANAKQMGEASWSLPYLIVCLIKILVRNAAIRSPRRSGSRMNLAGPGISGSAPTAAISSKRSRSSPRATASRVRSRPEGRHRAGTYRRITALPHVRKRRRRCVVAVGADAFIHASFSALLRARIHSDSSRVIRSPGPGTERP